MGEGAVTVSVSVAWRRGDLHGNNIEILDRAAKLRAKVGFLVAGTSGNDVATLRF